VSSVLFHARLSSRTKRSGNRCARDF
jgi:hypothetical protein